MLPKILFVCVVFLFVVLMQQNIPVVSQTQLPTPKVRPFTDLTFEIASPTQTLLPLQPVPIMLKLSNQTEEPVMGYKSVSFRGSPVSLYVRKNGSKERLPISPLTTISGLYGLKNIVVPPGDSYEAKEWIILNLNKYLPEPGIYELQAILANDDGTQTIESNVISIEIQEPNGANRNAYNLIKNSSFQEHLFSDMEFEKKKNVLERIANQYSNSSYAQNAYFVLGERHFIRRQYAQALAYFVRLENDNGFFFADKVRNYLAVIRQQNQQQ